MINYLIAILDTHATSFCYYQNPAYYQPGSALMPLHELEQVVDYVARNKISVNFLYGNHKLPKPYEELIESIQHVKIIPLKLHKEIPDGIIVINPDDMGKINEIADNYSLNLILRLEKKTLPQLADIFHALFGKFRRLNLCLLDIPEYKQTDYNEYQEQLKKIEASVTQSYREGNMVELNFISDRIMLQNMNNCDAGIKHVTAAPNGKLYLCPGFYYQNQADNLGTFQQELQIKNNQLLTLSHAPICRNCDAYHCKRCIFLNKQITLEMNTPSNQQCVTSHLERNISMRVLEALQPTAELFQNFIPIPALPYLDPYQILNNPEKLGMDTEQAERFIAGILSKPIEKLSSQEILFRIYKLEKEMIIRLKNMELKG